MLLHVHLQTRLDVLLLAMRTLDRVAFEQVEAFCVRQPNVSHQTVFVHETFATIRAAFRFGIVRLAMPSDFRLRMKHLAARTNEVLVLGPHLQVMPIPMLDQIRISLESFRAYFAFERSLAAVDAHVLQHILPQYKALRAMHTLVVAYIQMALQMNTEIDPSLEGPPASVTLARMREHVHVVCANTCESLLADATHIVGAGIDDRKEILIFLVQQLARPGLQRRPVVAEQIVVEAGSRFQGIWQLDSIAFLLAFEQSNFAGHGGRTAGAGDCLAGFLQQFGCQ